MLKVLVGAAYITVMAVGGHYGYTQYVEYRSAQDVAEFNEICARFTFVQQDECVQRAVEFKAAALAADFD